MHHEVNYTHITNDTKKRKAALSDCRQWLGRRHFNKILFNFENLVRKGHNMDDLIGLLSIAGIQGYPARVFVEHAQERATPRQLELDLQMPVTFKARIMPPVKI